MSTTQRLGIVAVGWLISVGVLWSAYVYEWSVVSAAVVAAVPWAVAAWAMGLAGTPPADVELDISKLALQGGLRAQTFAANEVVVRQGDVAEHFYIITAGRARVYVDDEYGSQIEVGELLVGQFFGEVGLLTGGKRNATVEATEELHVLAMDKQAFSTLVGSASVAADHIRSVAQQRAR